MAAGIIPAREVGAAVTDADGSLYYSRGFTVSFR